MNTEFVNSIDIINKLTWQSLTDTQSPLMNYDFYQTLEYSQSVDVTKGWQPHHLLCSSATSENIQAIMPMYLKQHSWGEYVFDWAWAEAYEQHDEPYYPKLVATLPFTPIPTDKLISNGIALNDVFPILTKHCQTTNINSWHILFVQQIDKKVLKENNVFQRNTVQFHWFNHQHQDFNDFLARFTARKRKNVKKERLSISQQNIKVRRILGKDITPEELQFFYLTYQLTYFKRQHSPHLTFEFFSKALELFPENILLIVASVDNHDVACAWFFFDEQQLYGRYWGCTQDYKNLHFELCYYQGIEFCIEQKLQTFNSGAQGEHKIQRGFEPILTHSYHWIKHTGFRPAIQQYCLQEQQQMQHYLKQCQQLLPFKNTEN